MHEHWLEQSESDPEVNLFLEAFDRDLRGWMNCPTTRGVDQAAGQLTMWDEVTTNFRSDLGQNWNDGSSPKQRSLNMISAVNYIFAHFSGFQVSGRSSSDLDVVGSIHGQILNGLVHLAALSSWRLDEKRIFPEGVDEPSMTTPTPDSIPRLMRTWSDEFHIKNTLQYHPLIRSALTLHLFDKYQPLEDGNSRASRVIAGAMNLEGNLPLLPVTKVFAVNKPEFLKARSESLRTGDPVPWVRFYSRAALSAMRVLRQSVKDVNSMVKIYDQALKEPLPDEKTRRHTALVFAGLPVLTPVMIANRARLSKETTKDVFSALVRQQLVSRTLASTDQYLAPIPLEYVNTAFRSPDRLAFARLVGRQDIAAETEKSTVSTTREAGD